MEQELCVTALRSYLVRAEKISEMLAESTTEPLNFKHRLNLMSQWIAENDADLIYLGCRGSLKAQSG